MDSVDAPSRLTVRRVNKNSAGRYSCSGRNGMGVGERKSVFLTVNCKLYFLLFSLITKKCIVSIVNFKIGTYVVYNMYMYMYNVSSAH